MLKLIFLNLWLTFAEKFKNTRFKELYKALKRSYQIVHYYNVVFTIWPDLSKTQVEYNHKSKIFNWMKIFVFIRYPFQIQNTHSIVTWPYHHVYEDDCLFL